jgi:hypothetical protein
VAIDSRAEKESNVIGRSQKVAAVLGMTLSTFFSAPARSDPGVETIVFIRHGEKPEKGLGQITCRGLNRALALPSVIAKTFGRPDAIFAPNPSYPKQDAGEFYDYVRPLATIEPTAIVFGLPVQAHIGVFETDRLQAALDQLRYQRALILVSWEHKVIESTARALLAAHGADVTVVPEWHRDDFDSIYVVTITNTGQSAKAGFSLKHQDLDGQSETCPTLGQQLRSQR